MGNLQPTTLVCYEAEIQRIFDGRDTAALVSEGMDAAALADAGWRDEMRVAGEARTQAFARRLIDASHNGLLVRSFAPGATADDLNLVLGRWAAAPPPGSS